LQQPNEFCGCSQKLNMCDLTANIADRPNSVILESCQSAPQPALMTYTDQAGRIDL